MENGKWKMGKGKWKIENGRWKTEQAPFIPRATRALEAASVVWRLYVGARGPTTKRIKHVIRVSFCVLPNEGCIAHAYVLYLKNRLRKTESCKHNLTKT